MNTPIKILLTITAAAALFLAHPAKANLITNPGFETGDLTGWSNDGGFGGFAADNSNPHSGSYAAVTCCSEGNGLTQTIHTVPGATYDLSLWVAAIDPTGLLDIHLFIVWNGSVLDEVGLLGTTPYFQLTYTDLVATGSATEIQFPYNFGIFGGLPTYLDDVSVTRSGVGVGEPFSTLWFALPVAGMIAFGLFRPKRVLAL